MRVLYVIDADGLDAQCFERFNTCLASLAQQTLAKDLVVSIADYSSHSVRERITAPEPLTVDYFHCPILDPFNKPFCINYAFRRFEIDRDPLFFFSDIDLVYPPDFTERFLHRYGKVHPGVCVTGMTFYQQAPDVLYTSDYETARDTIHADRRYRGGALMISTALYTTLRGYDERYFGWGKEDDDFIMRASREGVFIVDESVEFVHLYHPNKGLAPTFNTELFLERRRDVAAWSEERPWGEWESRPTSRTKFEWELAAGFPMRMPNTIVAAESRGLTVRGLDSTEQARLDQLGAELWRRCDGNRRFSEIITELSEEHGSDPDALDARLRPVINRLISSTLLVIVAERQVRPIIAVEFPADQGAFDLDLARWVIQKEADVVESNDESALPHSWKLYSDPNAEPPGYGAEKFNVLWTRAYPPDDAYRAFDFVVSPRVVVPSFESKSARMPNWLRLFSWEQEDPSRLSPELLTAPPPDPRRPRKHVCVLSDFRTEDSAKLLDEMARLGTVSSLPVSGGRLSPLDRFEAYWEGTFAIIDEPGCREGMLCDDLLIAVLAGAIPIYRGDPLIQLDFNAERFIGYSEGAEAAVTQLASGLLNDFERYAALLGQPIFNDDAIPYRLTADRVANRLILSWKEFVSGHATATEDAQVPTGRVAAI